MKSTKRLSLIAIWIGLLSLTSFAAEVDLISGTIQGDAKTINLALVLDENQDISGLKVSSESPTQAKETDFYTSQQAINGFVIYKEGKRDVVKLKSVNFAPHQGGHVKISYLYNGITGTRRSDELNLYRDGDIWKISHKGKEFTKIHFVKNRKRFVGVIGVKRIEYSH